MDALAVLTKVQLIDKSAFGLHTCSRALLAGIPLRKRICAGLEHLTILSRTVLGSVLTMPGRTTVDLEFLKRMIYLRRTAKRLLTLARLAGPGLAKIGATAKVPHGGLPYTTAQTWSRELAKHPSAFDGIAYHARHDDTELCFALYERSAASIHEVARETDLDQEWFWKIGERLGIGLAT